MPLTESLHWKWKSFSWTSSIINESTSAREGGMTLLEGMERFFPKFHWARLLLWISQKASIAVLLSFVLVEAYNWKESYASSRFLLPLASVQQRWSVCRKHSHPPCDASGSRPYSSDLSLSWIPGSHIYSSRCLVYLDELKSLCSKQPTKSMLDSTSNFVFCKSLQADPSTWNSRFLILLIYEGTDDDRSASSHFLFMYRQAGGNLKQSLEKMMFSSTVIDEIETIVA